MLRFLLARMGSRQVRVWLIAAGATCLGLLVGSVGSVFAEDVARFDSPQEAVKALLDATQAKDKGGLQQIFGPALSALTSGDEVQDKHDFEEFALHLTETHKLVKNDDGSVSLQIGRNNYPFPIPLVSKDGKWSFDVAAGKEEILNRRIGENELNTIAVCRAYVTAQREYYRDDWDGDDVLEYAQRFASTPGQRDGLYWESKSEEPLSPLGPLVAEARAEGYGTAKDEADAKPRPYHGYVYKILRKQGGYAPAGAFDYIINGNMVAGFSLVAYPVEWGSSGVMSFMVNSNGKVYEKNLGKESAELAAKIEAYDPDSSWSVVKD